MVCTERESACDKNFLSSMHKFAMKSARGVTLLGPIAKVRAWVLQLGWNRWAWEYLCTLPMYSSADIVTLSPTGFLVGADMYSDLGGDVLMNTDSKNEDWHVFPSVLLRSNACGLFK